jgi:hypothetical protein
MNDKAGLQEYINRGLNLLGVSIVGLSGFAFAPEIFLEKDIDDKLDDIGLLVVGVLGIFWYLWGKNKYSRSVFPVLLVSLSLVIKVVALLVEFKDAEAVGDDFGAIILFVLSLILVIYQYWLVRKLLKSERS